MHDHLISHLYTHTLRWFFLLPLYFSQEMQRHLQLLMESVESLQQETQKLLYYERSLSKQQQMKLQFIQRRVSSVCVCACMCVCVTLLHSCCTFRKRRTLEGPLTVRSHFRLTMKQLRRNSTSSWPHLPHARILSLCQSRCPHVLRR